MAEASRIVACPTCGKPVAWSPENRFRPFCCQRCRLVDLGGWAAEEYRLSNAGSAAKAESDIDDAN